MTGDLHLAMDRVVQLLHAHRLPLSDEKALQVGMASVFTAADLAFEREVRLSDADIVDFMIGTVAIEVKIGGSRRAIYRQLERYCLHDRVGGIILATNVADEAHAWARNLRLNNSQAKLVLSMLTLYVDGDGYCFVSIPSLAEDTDCRPRPSGVGWPGWRISAPSSASPSGSTTRACATPRAVASAPAT
jgi:hypothetical protein